MSSEYSSPLWPVNEANSDQSSSPNTIAVDLPDSEFKKNLIDFTAGAFGGTAALVVGHPLDTVKTVTQNATRSLALTDCISGVGQHGYKTFYKGLSLPLWSYAAVNACIFSSYKFAQRILDPDETSTMASGVCGAFAGLVQLIPGTPVEVIKIKMQNDATKSGSLTNRGPMSYVRDIIRTEGPTGLYRGLFIHALRDGPAFVIYFCSYKMSNDALRERNLIQNSMARTFCSGAIAGALSWVLLIPQDVMKTRIQAGIDKNIVESWRALRKMGRESFFRGGLTLTLRALLVNAITFLVYEECAIALAKPEVFSFQQKIATS